ncbi:MAG TPA: discoidin domain-containing protein [Phycisphaerae bacterium]|nr:discoidin domain-containing protein [Phycisphaerae bacterium]
MRPFRPIGWACAALLAAATAHAQIVTIDDFNNIDAWTVFASDGVLAEITTAPGADGGGMRLDFEFKAGAGYCIVRRAVPLELPENYRFGFAIRGDAPSNNLEFKLIDPSGENVWWVNKRDFTFPKDWETIHYKARHFSFGWGPSGGAKLKRLGSIEFAIAASSGGHGSVYFDSLTFEPLPVPQPVKETPTVHFSSGAPDAAAEGLALPADGKITWTSAAGDNSAWIDLDLHQMRELGGLVIDWAPNAFPRDYDVALSMDGEAWEAAGRVRGSTGGRDYVALPDAEARRVRIATVPGAAGGPIGLQRLAILDVTASASPNAFFTTIAADSPRGHFPAQFLGEEPYWTIVGVADDDKEALVDARGAVEVEKGAWSIEPFVHTGDRLLTWANVEISQTLAEGYIPIPTVTWRSSGLQLDATYLADGPVGASTLAVRYTVRNTTDERKSGRLFLAIRPFQVLPPWQNLNITGGVASIKSIARDGATVRVNADKVLSAWTPPDAFGAASFAQGDITEYLARGALPENASATDEAGYASAALAYDFTLAPNDIRTVIVAVPFYGASSADAAGGAEGKEPIDAPLSFQARLERTQTAWRKELNRVTLKLPEEARQAEDTFRATQAYILINGDGPSIQPGSRTYERSWIRDGAVTSTALLSTGHTEKVKAYLDWFCKYQYPDGKVPCVVDRRGPDPVPEHDSSGELVYAQLTYYRFTGDKAFLKAHLPNVVAAVNYLEGLRKQRMTDKYREGTPIERACYGLVPESISHEGYSAKPMHSYWDDFFTIKGFADATEIARILDQPELAKRFAALHQAQLDAVNRSLQEAMAIHKIDYLPGCVELGDFDATSTAIALFPCDLQSALPEPALQHTFDKYFDFFEKRRSGALAWENYTPYELRIMGAFVRLGQAERAHALLAYFLKDERPQGWREWAEVVWRDPATPRYIGDMPHTWVGSAFVNSVRAMIAYETQDAMVLLGGVTEHWLDSAGGITARDWPTFYGTLNLHAQMQDDVLTVELAGDARPPQGYRLVLPVPREPVSVEVDGAGGAAEDGVVALPANAHSVRVSWR